MVLAKLSKINVRIAVVPATFPIAKKLRYLFQLVLTMVRVSVSVIKVSLAQNGGPRGDLLVEVNVARHPIFQRQDMNIYSTAPITYAQAALGGEVKLNTVDGEVLYEVKPGTQTDTRIRLKGKGVPSLRNKNVRGDHYVTLVVQVPTNLNEDAKEALRKFDEACGNRPAGSAGDSTEKSEKKKKSFMDKLKETFEE